MGGLSGGEFFRAFYSIRNFVPDEVLRGCPARGLFNLHIFLVSVVATATLFLPFVVVKNNIFCCCNSFGIRRVPFCRLIRSTMEGNSAN